MSGREARAVEAVDGTRLHYEIEGDGPYDVLLCDGIGCDGYIWRYLWPHLLERARVIHPHVRGHGRSAPPADPARVGIAHIAEDFLRVLDACGSERAVVIGHSMGVQVSLELWHLAPTRVMGLGLMCGSYGQPASTFRDAQFMKHLLPYLQAAARMGGGPLRSLWRRLTATRLAGIVAQLMELHPDFTRPRDLESYLAHLADMDPRVFFDMLAGAEAHTAAPYLEHIDVPTLVIAGELDRFTPAWLSEAIAQKVPGAEAMCVRDGTHAAPVEQPTVVSLRVERFLDAHFSRLA